MYNDTCKILHILYNPPTSQVLLYNKYLFVIEHVPAYTYLYVNCVLLLYKYNMDFIAILYHAINTYVIHKVWLVKLSV